MDTVREASAGWWYTVVGTGWYLVVVGYGYWVPGSGYTLYCIPWAGDALALCRYGDVPSPPLGQG